jgi:hypothetical protein
MFLDTIGEHPHSPTRSSAASLLEVEEGHERGVVFFAEVDDRKRLCSEIETFWESVLKSIVSSEALLDFEGARRDVLARRQSREWKYILRERRLLTEHPWQHNYINFIAPPAYYFRAPAPIPASTLTAEPIVEVDHTAASLLRFSQYTTLLAEQLEEYSRRQLVLFEADGRQQLTDLFTTALLASFTTTQLTTAAVKKVVDTREGDAAEYHETHCEAEYEIVRLVEPPAAALSPNVGPDEMYDNHPPAASHTGVRWWEPLLSEFEGGYIQLLDEEQECRDVLSIEMELDRDEVRAARRLAPSTTPTTSTAEVRCHDDHRDGAHHHHDVYHHQRLSAVTLGLAHVPIAHEKCVAVRLAEEYERHLEVNRWSSEARGIVQRFLNPMILETIRHQHETAAAPPSVDCTPVKAHGGSSPQTVPRSLNGVEELVIPDAAQQHLVELQSAQLLKGHTTLSDTGSAMGCGDMGRQSSSQHHPSPDLLREESTERHMILVAEGEELLLLQNRVQGATVEEYDWILGGMRRRLRFGPRFHAAPPVKDAQRHLPRHLRTPVPKFPPASSPSIPASVSGSNSRASQHVTTVSPL